jgi:hypothetical protein
MVYTPIYNFSAPVGKYLEPATSSHPIKEEGYEIRPDFISLARELIFARSLEKKTHTNICNIFKKFVPTS